MMGPEIKMGRAPLAAHARPCNQLKMLAGLLRASVALAFLSVAGCTPAHQEATLGTDAALSAAPTSPAPTVPATGKPQLGIHAMPTPADLAKVFDLGRPRGMMITSVEQGSAQTAGIRQNDVILECNDRPTNSVADLQAAITNAPGAVLRCKVWSTTGSQDGKPVFAEKIVSMKTAPP